MKKLTQLGKEIGGSFYVAILTLYLVFRYLCRSHERKECVTMLKELWRTNENGKMKKEDKKIAALGLVVLVAAFATIFLVADYNASTWTKTYRLNEQYIGSIGPQRTQGLEPCDNCLIMEVQDEWWTPSGLMTENLTFFFANEHELRNDLQPEEVITVRWRWVDGERLIRGMWKE